MVNGKKSTQNYQEMYGHMIREQEDVKTEEIIISRKDFDVDPVPSIEIPLSEKDKEIELLKLQIELQKEQNKANSSKPSMVYRDVHSPSREARCPKCGSTSLSGNKKGFGIGKAVVGAALTGGIGLVAGNVGARKVRVTYLNCGKSWKA